MSDESTPPMDSFDFNQSWGDGPPPLDAGAANVFEIYRAFQHAGFDKNQAFQLAYCWFNMALMALVEDGEFVRDEDDEEDDE